MIVYKQTNKNDDGGVNLKLQRFLNSKFINV